MKVLTRRDFLKTMAIGTAGIGAIALAACDSESTSAGESEAVENTGASAEALSTVDSEATGAEKAEQLQAVADSANIVSIYDMMDVNNIDTTRESTYTTDKRIDTITIAVQTEITSWSPWQTPQGRNALILNIFEPLYHYQDGYALTPVLAKGYTDDDDTHTTVEIWDGIADCEGNAITAEDVVYCFDTFASSGNANDFNYYDSCEVVDATHIRFTWKSKIDSLTSFGTMMETLLYSRAAAESHDMTTEPVGSAAYYLDELVTGSKYTLKPNENYWQKDEANKAISAGQTVDTLVAEVITDSSMVYIAFEEGTILNTSINSTNLPNFLEGGKYFGQFTLVSAMNTGTNGIGFNMSGNSIMSDINMRLAVAYAVDSAGICAALGDTLYYAMNAEAGPTITGYNSEWDNNVSYYNTYDPELAKEYLAKTNYDGEPLIFLVQSGSDAKTLAAQIIQQELAVVGINVEIAAYERAIINTYLLDVTYWDLDLYQWAGDPISQMWGRQNDMRNYNHGYTETAICDEHFQEMIEKVQTKSGYTQELIDEIEAYIRENCLLYSVFGSISYTAYDTCLASYTAVHGHNATIYGSCNYYLD